MLLLEAGRVIIAARTRNNPLSALFTARGRVADRPERYVSTFKTATTG